MTNSEQWMFSYQERVNSVLDDFLPKEKTKLVEAMRYSVLNGGKRLRPILVYLASGLGDASRKAQDSIAGSIELIHCYSLIHDDLPAMDDDALRRGKPTCHKEFGEDIAILAGDAIQPLAYSLITDCLSIEESKKVKLISLLTEACGWNGMVDGQILDISENICSIKELDEMHKKKTGRLIVAALEMGGLISNLKIESISHLKNYGEKIGLAFQITDDIIDLESPSELTGKTQGSDIFNKKRTYPFFIGIEDSKKRAYKLCQEATGILGNVEGDTKNLTKLSKFIANRKY
tara:strand:+ start:518 stop:1387 length:870 start_codon:yes stop_codon:yes gene_type:complete